MSKSKQYRRRINIRLREETYDKLDKLSSEEHKSISEVIREIILKNI